MGTGVFMAPEIHAAQPYDYPADIFAVGGVLNCAMGLMETPYGSLEAHVQYSDSRKRHIAYERTRERVMNGIQKSLPQVICSCGDPLS